MVEFTKILRMAPFQNHEYEIFQWKIQMFRNLMLLSLIGENSLSMKSNQVLKLFKHNRMFKFRTVTCIKMEFI